jgi:hypothetical protein
MATQEPSTIYRALRTIKPLRVTVRAMREVLGRHRVLTWRLEGGERVSGHPLTIFFAGQLENKNFIADLAFDGSHTETICGKMWLWNVFKLAKERRGDYGLVIIDVQVPWYRLLKSPGAFLIPCWIRGEVDLAVASEKLKRSDSVKSDLRKIRQNDLQYWVTKDEQEFDRFYHRMYFPYVTRTYGDRAYAMTYAEMMKELDHCELLLVKEDADDVAGMILIYDGAEVRAWSLGVKDGDPAHVKAGTLAALYYFSMSHLINKGCQRLHLGATRAFLRDGVLQYKKKWGTRIVGSSRRWFVLSPQRNIIGVKAFLANNPFVFESDSGLNGAIFVGQAPSFSDDEVHKLQKYCYELGIQSVKIFRFPEQQWSQSDSKNLPSTIFNFPGPRYDT